MYYQYCCKIILIICARVAQWWSTSLPRRGSRVRSPSRAFLFANIVTYYKKHGIFKCHAFIIYTTDFMINITLQLFYTLPYCVLQTHHFLQPYQVQEARQYQSAPFLFRCFLLRLFRVLRDMYSIYPHTHQ